MRSCLLLAGLVLAGCRTAGPQPDTLTVAAASNLTGAFDEAGRAFTAKTGIKIVFIYGATANLASQIENGAPFDVFAAADLKHVDDLITRRRIAPESRAVFARGQLVLWFPAGAHGTGLGSLLDPKIRHIAIASPAAAPYGQAAVESLRSAGIWDKMQSKVVYATSISMAKQFAASGNADAAFTARSLVLGEKGSILRISADLHRPIEHAIGIVAGSTRRDSARSFIQFVLGSEGRDILTRYGYELP